MTNRPKKRFTAAVTLGALGIALCLAAFIAESLALSALGAAASITGLAFALSMGPAVTRGVRR